MSPGPTVRAFCILVSMSGAENSAEQQEVRYSPRWAWYEIYGLRVAIGLFVFLFFKITSESWMDWDEAVFISILFTVISVLIIFEIIEYTQRYLIRNFKHRLTEYKVLYKFYWANCLIIAPVVVGASYLRTLLIVPLFHCDKCGPFKPELIDTIAQSLVLSWLIILAKTFLIYMQYTRKSEREKALIQKELAQSKFESLKDQIKPHFLFNSFSVLTTIIEEDPKLAVEFVSRLSKIYRYVLDARTQLVGLKTEFEYLQHYIFLLKIRHDASLRVEQKIELDIEQYEMPILSLQMLVENALKHNYFSKEAPLRIEIYNEGTEFLVVRNNLKKREIMDKGTKLGLQNIMNRYQMLLDELIIVKEDEGYFTVKLPMIAKSDKIEA